MGSREQQAEALIGAHRFEEAATLLECAETFDPANEQARLLLVRASFFAGRVMRCEALCRAFLINGDNRSRWLDFLCRVLAVQGRIREALSSSEELLRETAYRPDFQSRAIHWAPCDDTLSAEDLLQLNRRYELHQRPAIPPQRFPNPANPARRLRVGFMSVEMFNHSKYFTTRSLLAAFDREQIQTFVYADIKASDSFTDRARQAVDCWRDVRGIGDDEVVRQIKADGIDILVDLMGHVPRNRLRCLLHKPAPILVEYLEAPSGLSVFDCRISDAVADPPGQTTSGATPLVRVPNGFHVYQPPEDAPVVRPAPAEFSAQPVFCCFAPAEKLSPPLLDAWASILGAVPNAWLVLKNGSFRDPDFVAAFRRRFEVRGIEPARIRCLPRMPLRMWHLLAYNLADLALDTFPYNGVITTCEALWMGTPVITLAGDHHMARRGASLLSSAGLDQLISHSVEEYVQKAVQLAQDRSQLTQWRNSLREQLRRSPLCDPLRVAKSLQESFREMWRHWCQRQSA